MGPSIAKGAVQSERKFMNFDMLQYKVPEHLFRSIAMGAVDSVRKFMNFGTL